MSPRFRRIATIAVLVGIVSLVMITALAGAV
jgi:hypothetical protein